MENPSPSSPKYKGDSPRWAAFKEFVISGLLVMTGVDLLVDGALVAFNRQKGESIKDYFKRDKTAVRFILLDVIVGVVAGIFQGSRAYRNAEKARNDYLALAEEKLQNAPELSAENSLYSQVKPSDMKQHAESTAPIHQSSHAKAIANERQQAEQADMAMHR